MKYKLIVTKKEENPNYAVEVAELEKTNRYNRNNFDDRGPQKEITTDALICELTDQQFKSLKAEVFKAFE